MSEARFTVDLPEPVAAEVERIARERGMTPADFVTETVVARVGSIEEAAAYFRERASQAKPGTAKRFFERAGGEPPQPGDEAE